MEEITICSASWNIKDSLALMMESARRYNPEFDLKFIVLDNGSWDGAREYAERQADLVLLGNNIRNHGWCLTEMIRRATSPWVMAIDNDAFFLKPGALRLMLDRMTDKTFCVCPERPSGQMGKGVPYGQNETIEWSPNVAFGLFKTDVIQRILQHFHLGYYGDLVSERVYETSGLAWRVGQVMGLDSVEVPELWNEYMRHEGSLSTLFAMCRDYPNGITDDHYKNPCFPVAVNGYKQIQRELAELRGCSVEELDAHEPPSSKMAQVIDLDWQLPKGTHVKLIPRAGIR